MFACELAERRTKGMVRLDYLIAVQRLGPFEI
jgi:hypothetical protein